MDRSNRMDSAVTQHTVVSLFHTSHRSSYQKPLCKYLLTERLQATVESQDPKPCHDRLAVERVFYLPVPLIMLRLGVSPAHPRFLTDT